MKIKECYPTTNKYNIGYGRVYMSLTQFRTNERNMSFPECYEHCEIVKLLGVSECENIRGCRWKFKDYREAYRKWAVGELHEEMKVDE